MNFGEILSEAYDECAFAATPDATIQARFKRWVNRTHRTILNRTGISEIRNATLSFATVPGQKYYGLPQAFERIDRIYSQTNPRRLVNKDRAWLRAMDPGETATGTPWVRIDWGLKPIFFYPASTGVWAVSTEAGDTTQTVRIRGVRANGDLVAAVTETLTGDTRVQIGDITDYVDVVQFSLSAAATGAVELYDAATNGNLLARIPIGRTDVQYQTVRLWQTPSAVEPLYVDGQLQIPDLVSDQDVPMLPQSYHDMLVIGARRSHWRKQGDEKRFLIADRELEERIDALVYYVQFPADFSAHSGAVSEEADRWNNLGGAFPADGYGKG